MIFHSGEHRLSVPAYAHEIGMELAKEILGGKYDREAAFDFQQKRLEK